MRAILLFLLLVGLATPAQASWYVFDSKTNRATSITQYEPDENDLNTRGEFAVQVDDTVAIPIEDAEYFNKKVRVRSKSQAELNKEQKEKAVEQEMAKVYHAMYKMAFKQAVKDGVEFSNQEDHIDDVQVVKKEALKEAAVADKLQKDACLTLKAEGKDIDCDEFLSVPSKQ